MDKILNQKIEKLDHFGRGIIKKDQNIIFVENSLPNDIVDINIIKKKKNIVEAKVDKYIKRSNPIGLSNYNQYIPTIINYMNNAHCFPLLRFIFII